MDPGNDFRGPSGRPETARRSTALSHPGAHGEPHGAGHPGRDPQAVGPVGQRRPGVARRVPPGAVRAVPGAVTRAVLFGSLARGEQTEDSDIDVLVIVHDDAVTETSAIETLGCRLSLESTALGSVIAVTTSEWAARTAARTRWHHDVETHGVSIL